MENAYQSTTMPMNSRSGSCVGVSREMASSTPTRKVIMSTRTLTSQASQERSSNLVFATNHHLNKGAQKRAAPRRTCLPSQLGDQREEWQIERNDNSSDANAQHANNGGLHHSEQVFGSRVHFVFVEVRDLLQHCVHGAGRFAHADHL